jgi:hypothetical protein
VSTFLFSNTSSQEASVFSVIFEINGTTILRHGSDRLHDVGFPGC